MGTYRAYAYICPICRVRGSYYPYLTLPVNIPTFNTVTSSQKHIDVPPTPLYETGEEKLFFCEPHEEHAQSSPRDIRQLIEDHLLRSEPRTQKTTSSTLNQKRKGEEEDANGQK